MVLLIAFLVSLPCISFANEIAFTFDDAPRGDGKIFSGYERTEKIVSSLKKHNIETVFFVNPERFRYPGRIERIKKYSDAGHLIANHTYSHADLRKVSAKDFISEISRADKLIQQFPTYVKWFRFPFLHEGETKETRDSVRLHLESTGYVNGYVTVDNYDYFLDDLVQKAISRGDKVDFEKACNMLVDVMWEGIQFYDSIAEQHIGNVKHILLMHENDIEALCLDKLISFLNSKRWKIISPTSAYKDPLLQSEPETLYLNQGRVAAIAYAKSGKKYKSRLENTRALEQEFEKRKIVIFK